MAPRLGRGKAFGWAHLNAGNGFTGNAGRTLGFLAEGDFAAPLQWLCHRPCLPLTNGRQFWWVEITVYKKCDSVDPLSLVIKCLGGGYKLGDLVVLIIDKQPPPSRGQVNTHILVLSFKSCYHLLPLLGMLHLT